jgi:hypothetical protein
MTSSNAAKCSSYHYDLTEIAPRHEVRQAYHPLNTFGTRWGGSNLTAAIETDVNQRLGSHITKISKSTSSRGVMRTLVFP